jgi:hypothetical protein
VCAATGAWDTTLKANALLEVSLSAPNPNLAGYLAGLKRDLPWASAVLDRLRQEGWAPTDCSPRQDGAWWLFVQTLERAQRRFGLVPEILVLLCAGHVQSRFLKEASARFLRSGGRLETSFVVVVDPERDLEGRLQALAGNLCAVPWAPGAASSLLEAISRALPLYDPFDVRSPVRGQEIIGRDELISGLIRDLQRHPGIGVFGLRKMGKTTVALAAGERLDPQPREKIPASSPGGDLHPWLVVSADAQTYASEGFNGLCRALTRSLTERLPSGGPAPRGGPITALRLAIERATAHASRVLVIVDEFDYFFDEEAPYSKDAVSFLAMVRGVCQERPDQVRFVFVGRAPELLNASHVGRSSNPTLNFWRPLWVPPLSEAASGELLRRLGKRTGLEVGHEVKAVSWGLAGGHPFLTRLFGSSVREVCLPRLNAGSAENLRTDQGNADAARALFLRGEDARKIVGEVRGILADHYPAAHSLLLALSKEEAGGPVFQAAAVDEPEEVETLSRFGLLDATTGRVPGFLLHHLRPPPRRAQGRAA